MLIFVPYFTLCNAPKTDYNCTDQHEFAVYYVLGSRRTICM